MGLFALVPLFFIALVLLIFGGIAALLIWILVRTKRRQQAIGDTPFSRIGELEKGPGKIRGRVVALESPLSSPLSRTPCVYFSFRVEEQRTRTVSHGPRGGVSTQTYWHAVVKDRQAIPTEIEDDTGRARVDLLEAETVLKTNDHKRSGLLNDAPPRLQKLLREEYGYSTKGLIFNKTVRYIEEVICEGDRLFVFGEVRLRKNGTPSFTKGEHPFIVSDKNEAQLLQHYRTRIMWCYIGLGVTGVFGAIFLAIPVFFLVVALLASRALPPAAAPGPGSAAPPTAQPAPQPPPAPQDPVTAALEQLKSPDAFARGRAADDLARLQPEEDRRAEVVAALEPLLKENHWYTPQAAKRALAVWDNRNPAAPQAPAPPANPFPPPQPVPPRPKLPKRPKLPEQRVEPVRPPAEPEHPRVAWEVKLDPVTPPPERINLRGSLPMKFMGLAVYSSSPHSTMLAMPPPGSKDKSVVQVYDIRQMKPVGVPIRGSFGGHAQMFALSPDGAYFATLLQKTERTTIEVWSSATGQSVRKLEVDPDPEMKVTMFDFVHDNHLITLKHKGQFPDYECPCFYQVWDVKTGAEVAHFDYDLRFIPRWGTFSPNRKYMVLEHTRGNHGGYHIYFWDLHTGKVTGDIEFQDAKDPWGQAGGIAFTPDGEHLAMLWRLNEKGGSYFQLLSFDLKTGKKVHSYRIENATRPGEYPWTKGGASTLQWVPDGSGWLLFGHLLVDARTGAITRKLDAAPTWEGNMVERRFLDARHVTTLEGGAFDKTLKVLTLPGGERK